MPLGADDPVIVPDAELLADPELLPDFVSVAEVLPEVEVAVDLSVAEEVALLVFEPVDEACDAELLPSRLISIRSTPSAALIISSDSGHGHAADSAEKESRETSNVDVFIVNVAYFVRQNARAHACQSTRPRLY